jgi:prepilin-type N-terminal cleavage/methylation domain-containing protein
MKRDMKKSGFTLVEMLVVIGIIAVLSAAGMVGYSRVIKSARKAKTVELVSNVATALTHILNKEGTWPEELLQNVNGQLDKNVAKVFIRYNLLGLSHNQKSGSEGNYTLVGKDRCGIVDAEAEAVLKRNKRAMESTSVPSGRTVQEHILYYAIDDDGDGFTEVRMKDSGMQLKVRATAVVYAAGPNGIEEYSTLGRNDDVYSWRPSQVKGN